MGQPTGPLLAYGSSDPEVNMFAVGDQMQERGWSINRLQRPDGLHAMITASHLEVVDDYLRDLKQAVATVKANPELAKSGSAATYGMMSHIPLRGMVRQKILDLFAQMYQAGGHDIDLHEQAAIEPGLKGQMNVMIEKLAQWYVTRQQQKMSRKS
jgi:hypothetical protein